MQTTPLGARFFLPVRLAVCAACFTFAAYGGPLTLSALAVQVTGGSIVNSSSSTSWSGIATSGPEAWIATGSSIFLPPSSSNIFGLTNSEFQCDPSNIDGCGGLGIRYTLLGVAVSSLPTSGELIIGLDGSTTFSGPLQALYAVTDSGPTVVPLVAPVGSIPLSTVAGAFAASNATTPVLFSCPLCSGSGLLVNIDISLLIEPSTPGARFSNGDTVTLPSSFTVTVADAAVPEPVSGVIAGLGLAALGAWRRVRTSARKRESTL